MDKCDICQSEVNLHDVYHFSGTINGDMNNHIHACKKCVKLFELHNNFLTIQNDGVEVDDAVN